MKIKWIRILSVLGFGLSTENGLAAIRRSSSEAHKTVRGDQITLGIEGDHDADAQWFTRGQKLCKGARCVIETGELLPGEYQIDVLIKVDQGNEVDALHFRIAVEASPPLYRPQAINAELAPVEQSSAFTHIGLEDLWLTAVQGRITRNERRDAKTVFQTSKPSPAVPKLNEIMRVPSGSIAISGGLNRTDELVIAGPTELKRIETGLWMHSGQFLWRRFPNGTGTSAYPKIPLTTYATIASAQPGDTFIHTGVNESHPAVDVFAIGSAVEFQCGKETIVIPESTRMIIIYESKGEICTVYSRDMNASRQDLGSFYKDALRHWLDLPQSDIWKFWFRSDVTAATDDQNLTTAKSNVEARQWGFALDHLSAIASCSSSSVCLVLKGQASLAVGLLAEAQKYFGDALILNPEDPDAAFQMARIKFQQKNFSEAVQFYELAARNHYRDLAEARRGASQASEADGLLRPAMVYTEAARLAEPDLVKSSVDMQNRDRLQRKRPWSGHIEGLGEVVSHVLPIAPDTFGDLPNNAKTNRGMMAIVRGTWQRVFSSPKSMSVRISGKHNYAKPLNSAQAYGSYSDHNVMLEAKAVNPPTIGIDTDLSIGTQLRGGARQVDVYGAKLGALGGSAFQWNIALISSRALDPAPGGNDAVDARINRFIDPTLLADHSHFDFGFTGGLGSASQDQKWQLQTSYQTIDFRTGIMDDYDATELSFDGSYQRPFSQRWRGEFSAHQWQRTYVVRGKDQWLSVDFTAAATIIPLWEISAYVGYFTRSAADDVATYQGQHYGLGVGVLL